MLSIQYHDGAVRHAFAHSFNIHSNNAFFRELKVQLDLLECLEHPVQTDDLEKMVIMASLVKMAEL